MASVAAPRTRDRVAEVLDSERRLAFLAELAWHLVIANRFWYPSHETDAYRHLSHLICLNEVQHVLTSQLRSDFGDGRDGYPDQALLASLISKSRIWACETACGEAIREAVASTSDGSPSSEATGHGPLIASAEYALASDRRATFLSALFSRLTETASSAGPHGASDLAAYVEPIRCCNELLRYLASQIRADLNSDRTAPDGPALAEKLIDNANSGSCGGGLRYAFERALARFEIPT